MFAFLQKIWLLSQKQDCSAGNSFLAREFGVDARTIQRWIRHARKNRLLVPVIRRSESGTKRTLFLTSRGCLLATRGRYSSTPGATLRRGGGVTMSPNLYYQSNQLDQVRGETPQEKPGEHGNKTESETRSGSPKEIRSSDFQQQRSIGGRSSRPRRRSSRKYQNRNNAMAGLVRAEEPRQTNGADERRSTPDYGSLSTDKDPWAIARAMCGEPAIA